MADHVHRATCDHEHDSAAHVPVQVGAADDHAERDAEARAQQALARLAAAPPVPAGEPGSGSRVRRAHAPSAPGAIGAAGGALDAGSEREIRTARGAGRPLPTDVRSTMESAFGRSFAAVRVHDGPGADRVARRITAEAFTTGNDIFFSAGAFAPGTEEGRHVLAHELGHVAQASSGIHRWNPFKRKEKSPEELAAVKAARERKEQLIAARAELKAKDKAARAQAKAVNAKNKQVSKQVTAAYQGNSDPTFKPAALKDLEVRLKEHLDLERYVRSRARHEVLQGREETERLAAEADLAEEQAVEELWASAPEDVRAFRPLRYDEFDKALNEVRQARTEAMAQEQSDIAAKLAENEAKHGAPMKPKDAAKKVAEQRELERRRQRAAFSTGTGVAQTTAHDDDAFKKKGEQKVAEIAAERPLTEGERQRVQQETERKAFEEKYGHDEDLLDAKKGLKTAGTATKLVGKADKKVNKQLISQGVYAEDSDAGGAHELAAKSTGPLAEIFSLVSSLIGLADQIRDIRNGVADPGAKLEATRTAVGSFTSGAKITRSTLKLAREGVEKFGGSAQVVSDVGTALPIVGLVTSALGVIDKSLELVPLGERLGAGLQSVEEAVLERKGPLAASMKRVNSRNAQLVEKATFGLAKNVTMLSLHVAELASAGGFGVPAAAKLTLTITDYAHRLGHKVYDMVGESKSSTAITDFGVKHKEAASRDVLKYDIGTSIDVIIVAAQKHQLEYARSILLGYGIREHEIDSMRHHELREKALDGLDAEGDPKTVTEKVEEAKSSVKEKLGLDDKPGGKKEEQSTLQKIKEAPAKVGGAIAGLPEKIVEKVEELKDKHADAKKLVAQKNDMGYKGNSARGKGSTLLHFLRGEDKTEKSFAKVRTELAVDGTAPDALPRTKGDTESREKVAKAKAASQQVAPTHQFDPAFAVRATKATMGELYQLVAALKPGDPCYEGNLEYVSYEVERRVREGIG